MTSSWNVWNYLAYLPLPWLPPLIIAEHMPNMNLSVQPYCHSLHAFCTEGFGIHLLIMPSVNPYLSSTSQPYPALVFIQSKYRRLLLRCLYYKRQKIEPAVFVTWGVVAQNYVCLPVQLDAEIPFATKPLFHIS